MAVRVVCSCPREGQRVECVSVRCSGTLSIAGCRRVKVFRVVCVCVCVRVCVFYCAGSIYLAITLVMAGMVAFVDVADKAAPISYAFQTAGLGWATHVINVVSEPCGSGFHLLLLLLLLLQWCNATERSLNGHPPSTFRRTGGTSSMIVQPLSVSCADALTVSVLGQGSLFGLTAGTFTGVVGQPRVFFRMASGTWRQALQWRGRHVRCMAPSA